MKRFAPPLAALALLALAFGAAAQPASSFTLVGEDGRASEVVMGDLAALPRATASITHEGKTTAFEGVLLADVLKRVGALSGDKLRGPALSDVVIVAAKDGYMVALALSDLEPSIHPSKVILAYTSGGQALGDKDGPFRLVVDGDLKPARSERNVVRIELRRLRPAA